MASLRHRLAAGAALARAADIEGSRLYAGWGLPFAGMLLSIAVQPLAVSTLWHRHFGKIVAGWMVALLLPLAAAFGPGAAGAALVHTVLSEYVLFVVLLVALFTVAGGIHVRGDLRGRPGVNVAILALGSLLAGVMGTTGASVLMIRPLIRANERRRHSAHVVVFFIFAVSNVGGSLTALGDPPLFLGFLRGVDFFWTARHLFPQTMFLLGALLAIFYVLDRHWHRSEGDPPADPTPDTHGLGLDGAINLLPLALVVALVLMSGLWKPGLTLHVLGTELALPQIVRDLALVAVTLISLAITPRGVRSKNRFSWAPMQEVATLFVGSFVTMLPVLAMLKVGVQGPFAAVVRAISGADGQPLPWAYFWCSGALSAFLDNAPTYLVFFNLAGGEPAALMTTRADTLAAISAGSVFMSAASYIGNAPNFMVKAIAEDRGMRMPGPFEYMGWSGCVLLPLFAVQTLIWFR